MGICVRKKRRRVKGPRSDGARALDAWLVAERISVPAFCESHGLDRIIVQHAMSGRVRSAALDLAFAVQAATGGDIPAQLWRASTVRWDAEDPAEEVMRELDKASGE